MSDNNNLRAITLCGPSGCALFHGHSAAAPLPLSQELVRLGAMSAAWDDAAAALQRRDTPAFDHAMSKFNSLKERQ